MVAFTIQPLLFAISVTTEESALSEWFVPMWSSITCLNVTGLSAVLHVLYWLAYWSVQIWCIWFFPEVVCGVCRNGKGNFTWRLNLYLYIARIYIWHVNNGLCIISVKLNFEKSSVVTYLLSIDTRWGLGLDWLREGWLVTPRCSVVEMFLVFIALLQDIQITFTRMWTLVFTICRQINSSY